MNRSPRVSGNWALAEVTAPGPVSASAGRGIEPALAAEAAVKVLYRTLSGAQRLEICFDWNHRDPQRGLLRSFVANHWQVTRPCIRSDFFTREQQHLIHEAFTNLLDRDWYPRFLKQLRDDTNGHAWGADQSIALFGDPESGSFQFVLCGRHLTLRAGGDADGRAAFGGPIFYGHQATGYYERPNHPGNVFWVQAIRASQLFAMLDPAQCVQAVVPALPPEPAIGFRTQRSGLPVAALSQDQKQHLAQTLGVLVEPFRAADRARVMECLARQGGLDHCHLTFARDGRMSAPHWDNWRLEGPSLVWHFRGFPHVHVWVHVADDPAVPVNAGRGAFLFPNHDPLR